MQREAFEYKVKLGIKEELNSKETKSFSKAGSEFTGRVYREVKKK